MIEQSHIKEVIHRVNTNKGLIKDTFKDRESMTLEGLGAVLGLDMDEMEIAITQLTETVAQEINK